MNQSGDRTGAAERARWLAELAQAVDQAERLAWSLGVSQASAAEVEGLCRQLEVVRIEIEALRRGGRRTRQIEIDPIWTSLFPTIGNPN